MKLSASIYSNKDKELDELIKELDAHKIDFFHIDCNDNPEVFNDIAKIRKISNTKIDLHLITSTPDKFFNDIIKYNVENVTFQFENLKSKIEIPESIKATLGLAIVSETDISVFEEYKDKFSHILFMTTTPGISGGKFNKENFKKIRQFKNNYPDKKIHIDGGINDELSFILRNMGVYASVIGSYLFKNNFIGSALLNLKSDEIGSHYTAKDFMLEIDESPILKENEFNFLDILLSIEKYNLGFTIIENSLGELDGIITNADIRKGLINSIGDLNKIDVKKLINKNPVFAFENNSVTEILNHIKTLDFPILFMPVVNENKKVVGVLKFNNLIKGEL